MSHIAYVPVPNYNENEMRLFRLQQNFENTGDTPDHYDQIEDYFDTISTILSSVYPERESLGAESPLTTEILVEVRRALELEYRMTTEEFGQFVATYRGHNQDMLPTSPILSLWTLLYAFEPEILLV